MSLTIRNGKVVHERRTRIPTLYHFTAPENLPRIFEKVGIYPGSNHERHSVMTGGVPVVWLTTNPDNTVTDEDMARFRSLSPEGRPGLLKQIAEYEAGRCDLFGGNETGCARLTLSFAKKERNVMSYLQWMIASGASDATLQHKREDLGE